MSVYLIGSVFFEPMRGGFLIYTNRFVWYVKMCWLRWAETGCDEIVRDSCNLCCSLCFGVNHTHYIKTLIKLEIYQTERNDPWKAVAFYYSRQRDKTRTKASHEAMCVCVVIRLARTFSRCMRPKRFYHYCLQLKPAYKTCENVHNTHVFHSDNKCGLDNIVDLTIFHAWTVVRRVYLQRVFSTATLYHMFETCGHCYANGGLSASVLDFLHSNWLSKCDLPSITRHNAMCLL